MMNSTHEDSVLNFDLDFLQPTSVPAPPNKQRFITQLKKRIAKAHTLQSRYYAIKQELGNKSKKFEEALKKLESTNQEYKQTSIEYKHALDSIAKCESENHQLKISLKRVEDEYFKILNEFKAAQSHAGQLQQLVKQQDRKIELLEKNEKKKNDKAIENKLIAKNKQYEKEILEWKKKYEILRKQFQDHKCAKRKPVKDISSKNNSDSLFDDHSDNDDDISEEIVAPFRSLESSRGLDMNQRCRIGTKDNVHMEMDNDCHEIISVDTGCGSSLASSDNEKWLNSPDYVFSPIHSEGIESNRKRKLVNAATSPIQSLKMIEVVKSPVLLVNTAEIATSPLFFTKTVNIATSPIPAPKPALVKVNKGTQTQSDSSITKDSSINPPILILTSPTTNIVKEGAHTSLKTLEKITHNDVQERTNDKLEEESIVVENIPQIIAQERQKKLCLDVNNSNNVTEDRCSDNEVEMIFNTMRFNNQLITPIPRTPTSVSSRHANSICVQTEDVSHKDSHQNIPPLTEYKGLVSNVATLMKEVELIKTIIRYNKLAPGTVFETDLTNNNTVTSNVDGYSDQLIFVQVEESLCGPHVNNSNKTPARSPDGNLTVIPEETLEPENGNQRSSYDTNVLISDSCLETELEECPEEDTVLSETGDVNNKVGVKSTTQDSKKRGARKLTNLGKYRKKCELRKYKIRRESPPVEKPRMKPKKLPNIKKITKNDTSLTLNDKDVYANAVKVMAELNGKKLKCSSENSVTQQETTAAEEKQNTTNKDTPVSLPALKPLTITEDAIMFVDCGGTSLNSTITSSKHVQNSTVPSQPAMLSPYSKSLIYTDTSPIPLLSVSTDPPLRPEMTAQNQPINSVDDAILPSRFLTTTPRCYQKVKKKVANSEPGVPAAPPKHAVTVASSVTKSDPDISRPRRSLRSPKYSVRSPQPDQSPDPLKSSKYYLRMPKYTVTSPEHDLAVISPIPVMSPSHDAASPENALNSPDSGVKSPRRSFRSPKRFVKLLEPELAKEASKPVSKLSELAIRSPDRVIKSPVSYPLSPISNGILSGNEKHVMENCVVVLSKDPCQNIPCEEFSKIQNRIHENLNQNDSPAKQPTRKRTISNSDANTHCKSKQRCIESANSEEYTKLNYESNNEKRSPAISKDDISSQWHPKESLLCGMVQKYGINTIKRCPRNIPDAVLSNICLKIETCVLKLKEIPYSRYNSAMDDLIAELQKYDYKIFVSGLMKYLTSPDRKAELHGKRTVPPPIPQMTQSEEVLLYVMRQLRRYWHPVDIVDTVLSSIEYTLFKLNRTPDFNTIESVSHFYALLCRYFNLKSRLLVFMLDAMYCILFKSVPLIKQCLDVWPLVIPLAHMSAAKTPLVTCLIYLLHFYKCEDKYNRVQDIRNILSRRYFYQFSEWNETKILDLLRSAIKELKDIPAEKKMLRIGLIILAKRHGPRWAQNNIIKNLLQPFIENDKVAAHLRAFCISLVGPLMKPFPNDMKADCEIAINQIMNILNTTTSPIIEEAAIATIIIMARHNYERVNEFLLSRKMQAMSREVEELIRNHIRTKPLRVWVQYLPKIAVHNK